MNSSSRYAAWIGRHAGKLLVVAALLTGVCTWLSVKLELRADFVHLLPPDKQSVRELEALKQRVRVFGSLFFVVDAKDATPKQRSQAAHELVARLRTLDKELVSEVAANDDVIRSYFWNNRFMFAELDELTQARDALVERVKRAKLRANPLYIDLDDDEAQPDALNSTLSDLRDKLAQAEARRDSDRGFVSKDGRFQLVVVRSAFPSSEVSRGERLISFAKENAAQVGRANGVAIGLAGDVYTTLEEHHSILHGMLMAMLITVGMVLFALAAYYRSAVAICVIFATLSAGSIVTFGVTYLLIGHLNLATAFLGAIVVGNGINPVLIFLSRYYEELRAKLPLNERLGRAIRGALPGTLAGSLTASVAYASLLATDFRGFRHFGAIGGIGMVLCWISTFTVLPALLVVLDRHRLLRAKKEAALGRALAALLPKRHGLVVAIGAAIAVLCAITTVAYLAGSPLEQNWQKLRSDSPELQVARAWNTIISRSFEGSPNRNLSGRFAIGLPDRAAAQALAIRLRALDEGKGENERLFDSVTAFDDLIPPAQAEKVAVLGEIRTIIDDQLGAAELSDADQELVHKLRPPDDLQAVTQADLPNELSWPFTERDGSQGKILLVSSGARYNTWNVGDLVAFAEKVRTIPVGPETQIGGQPFIFADMLRAMKNDGPKATFIALFGSVLAVWLVVGRGRHAAVTLVCAASGTLAMIAIAALAQVKINFLDFIALPITIGIGIDYAVNIAAREREDWRRGPHWVLTTTGGAVFLCSFTTTVGYGSLLLSDNAGIRSFGLAAILGELACGVIALYVAPSMLALLRERDHRKGGAALAPPAAHDSPGRAGAA